MRNYQVGDRVRVQLGGGGGGQTAIGEVTGLRDDGKLTIRVPHPTLPGASRRVVRRPAFVVPVDDLEERQDTEEE